MSVNLSPVGGAAAQFLDNNGNPLTGGKLYTYEAGTTTPQATYTTSAGNVAHANPIILDAAGRVPGGEIWLTASLDYKFSLFTSADVLIATWDNITTSIITNASNVVYDPAGSGAVQRTVESKLRDVVSVLDFGADPTGATDSTTAIQAAINAALGSNQGTLHLPAGTYAVTSLNIYPTGGKSLVMVGDGPNNSKFVKFGVGTNPILNISGTAGGGGGNGVVSKCQFKNFMIQGTSKLFTGMYVDTLAHFFMEGVHIASCDIALRSLGSLIFAARSCFFMSNDIGFQADQSPVNNGYSNLIKFDDCVFQSNALYHGLLNKGQQIVFQNCDCESGAVGFRVASTYEDETTLSSVTWNNCWWEGNSSNPVIIDSDDTWVMMRDCTLYGPASSITINGADNHVQLQNCYGTENLNMADATGSISIDNCLFPVYSISTQNHTINRLFGSGGGNPTLPSVTNKMLVTGGASPNTADTNSGAVLQVDGNTQSTNGFISKKQITVTTSDVPLVTVSLTNVLVFVHGYNTSGGAQGWWLLAGTSVIDSSDSTGTTPIFSFVGSVLNMRTTTGTLELNVSALL